MRSSAKAEQILETLGYKKLLPLQERLLARGLLEGRNIFMTAPTATGKTAAMELALIHRCLTKNASGIYALPYKALTDERHRFLESKYGHIISVEIRTGDYIDAEVDLSKPTIMLCTYEKLDKILLKGQGLEHVGTIVIDEGHFLGDPNRGARLEGVFIALRRLTEQRQDVQLVVASATVGNPAKIALWMEAEYEEGKPQDQLVRVSLYNEVVPDRTEQVLEIVKGELKKGGQVVVFVNSVARTRSVAKQLAGILFDTDATSELLKRLLDLPEPTRDTKELTERLLPKGVAIHHASLAPEEREIIEQGFRDNRISVIVSTTTLAAGVNLPAACVCVLDAFRESYFITKRRRREYLTPNEILQMLGRAGRPGMVEEGRGYLILDRWDWDSKFRNLKELWRRVEDRDVFPVESQLRRDYDMLRLHILRLILASNELKLSEDDIIEQFKYTFDFFSSHDDWSAWKNTTSLDCAEAYHLFERGEAALDDYDPTSILWMEIAPDQIEMGYEGNEEYDILVRRGEISCTCWDMKVRGFERPCKHVVMAFIRGLTETDTIKRRFAEQLFVWHKGKSLPLFYLVKCGLRSLVEDGLLTLYRGKYEPSHYAIHAFDSYLRPTALSKIKNLIDQGKRLTLNDVIYVAQIDRQELVDAEVVNELLNKWRAGEDIDPVCETFHVPYAEFTSLKESVTRCAQAIIKVCRDVGSEIQAQDIEEIIDELNHGVPREALPLKAINIRGLGRRTAVHLVENGITTLAELTELTAEELATKGRIRRKETAGQIVEEAKDKHEIMTKLREKSANRETIATELRLPIYDVHLIA